MSLNPETKEAIKVHCESNNIDIQSGIDAFKFALQHPEILALEGYHKTEWVSVSDRLPKPLQTVWISNGKGWTTLGCRSEPFEDTDENGESKYFWCWSQTNGIIYEENGQIVSECEGDDLDVQYWHPLPPVPNKK